MTDRELMQQALDALDRSAIDGRGALKDALRAALAQPEAEPVARFINTATQGEKPHWEQVADEHANDPDVTPLYATPQAQPAPADGRKLCTCDGAGRGPGRACVVKAGGRLGDLWRCAHGIAGEGKLPPAGTVTLQEDIAEALAAPAVLEPLTAERLQKHAMFAADAPPASAVVLVSSLHRLLGITGDSNG